MSEFSVELREVVKKFVTPEGHDLSAVDHVTIQIRNGEFFSLLGSSGCGKTTSLRMIAGFEWPTSGEVFINRKPMGHTPPFQRPVNTVFQNYALFQHMNVFQNIAFGLEMKKVPKKEISDRVGQALELVKLKGMGKRTPRQLSGGQQQRVALARALVNKPEVLLLDEPLGALDLKLRKEMQLELKALQQEVGITFIYVTHDQEEALTMSDRIAVMSFGKVLQIGSPVEIYELPNCKFVADFIGTSNFFDGKVVKHEDGKATIHVPAMKTEMIGKVNGDFVEGQSAILSIRPEKIRVSDKRLLNVNCLEGKIINSTYIGSETHILVDVNGFVLKVWEQNRISSLDPDVHYEVGQKIWLTLFPENSLVIAAD
jgi:spermidine/putrescine transport system ATP-binding protein